MKTMTQKKLIRIAALVIAAVWVFCLSFLVASRRLKKEKGNQTLPATTPTAASTAPQSFSEPSKNASTSPKVSIDGNRLSTSVTVGDPDWVKAENESKKASEAASIAADIRDSSKESAEKNVPSGKKKIIAAYCEAVNELKKTSSFTLVKEDKLNVEIDSITGGTVAKKAADSLINSNTKSAPVTYSFSGGMDASSGKSPSAVIAPLGSEASLSPSDVTSAAAVGDGKGGYTLKLLLGEGVQTLSSPAKGYSTSMEVINVDSLGLSSSMSVSELNITYDSSSIEAKIDKDGRLTSMTHKLVVTKATGKGKMMMVSVDVELHGSYTSTYSVTY